MPVTGLYVQDEPEFLRSFWEKERERQRWWRLQECEWEGDHLSHSLLLISFLCVTLSRSTSDRSPPLACLAVPCWISWEWNCCALAEILRQCHITYQNVQHLYIVQLWAEGEMCGWDVACGGSIERSPPWLWLDPLCPLYSGPSVTPAEPG